MYTLFEQLGRLVGVIFFLIQTQSVCVGDHYNPSDLSIQKPQSCLEYSDTLKGIYNCMVGHTGSMMANAGKS